MDKKKAFKVCKMLLEWSNMPPGIPIDDIDGKTDFEFIANDIIPLAAEALKK